MARVLLTDAQERAVLAAARSLHLAGYEVAAGAYERPAMTLWSRSCDRGLALPDSRREPERFIRDLEGLVRDGDYDVLLPGSDAALEAIVAHRERIEPHVKVGLPPDDAVKRTFDRLELPGAAAAAGLSAPPTIACPTPAAITQAAEQLGLPLMVKTRWPVVQRASTTMKLKSAMVTTEPELARAIELFAGCECVVQAVVPGHELSCAGVMTNDGLLAMVVSRYERSWPVRAGDVCFSTTVAVPPNLQARLDAMLRHLGWTGIFELEMIAGGDGSLTAIDLNPRVYGSLALAAASGAPLAVLWCDWLLDRAPRFAHGRPGQLYRREDGDLRNALWHLHRGQIRAGLAPLRPRRKVAHALFELDDPAPLLARAIRFVRGENGRTENGRLVRR